jgi:carnosine N-methyltransferase
LSWQNFLASRLKPIGSITFDTGVLIPYGSQYSKVAHYNTTHLRRQSFYALPQSHWQLLAAPPFSYLDTLSAVDDAIDENAELATAILQNGLESFGFPFGAHSIKDTEPWRGTATSTDLDKARSTLRQFYRDWSEEGAPERAASLERVIEDLRIERQALKDASMSVLVPGAGLARLVFELCKDGFNVEGNEISYQQLLASSYILNYCPAPKFHTIYPWIHSFSNHTSRTAHLQSVQIPDVHPGTELQRGRLPAGGAETEDATTAAAFEPGEMSMSASDFLSLYEDEAHKDTYDAVATVFFLDTAPNPIRYIETIKNCLKPGGIWTNVGPLLWHFENNSPGHTGSKTELGAPASKIGVTAGESWSLPSSSP